MDYSEKWGKDVDEAVRLALEDLGLTENQVMVTVLEEPAKGFLGLGQKLAKVRVEKIDGLDDEEDVKPPSSDSKPRSVTKDLRKKNKPNAGGQGSGGRDRGRRDRDYGDRGRGRDYGDRSRGRDRDRDYGDRSRGRDRDYGDRNRDRDHGDRGRDRNYDGRGRNKVRGYEEHNRNRDEARKDYNNALRDTYEDLGINLSDKPQFSERPTNLTPVEENDATLFLKSIMDNMRLRVRVSAFENDECVFIEISGDHSRTVIGKRGQTLDSIQYLTNLVANKDREEYRRVIIDVEGYRSRREQTLERLAAKLARKVVRSGKDVRLEPMNPYERKVIHATLQKVSGISTRSEGEEPYRRVIIAKE
jgi:spoIIIJ-associated protein